MKGLFDHWIMKVAVAILGAGILADLLHLGYGSAPYHDEWAGPEYYEPMMAGGGMETGELSWSSLSLVVLAVYFFVIYQIGKLQERREAERRKILKEWNQAAGRESPPPWQRG